MLTAVLRDGPGPDRGATAGWSRSSSGTRSSGCSGSPPPTRTIPSARSGRRLRICEDAEEPRGPRRARHSACGSGSTPARRSSGSGSPRARASGSWPATRSTPRRGSSRSPPRWGSRSASATYEATERVFDYEELAPATLKGKAEPVRVFRRHARRGPASAPTSRAPTTPRSSAARSTSALLKGLFDKSRRRELGPARHGRRGARHRQEPDRGRACSPTSMPGTRADHLASGPVPALRRRHHVLGAGRDRQGPRRDPRVRRSRGRRRQARRRRSPRARSATGSVSGCCRCSGSRRPRPAEREELFTAWRTVPRAASPTRTRRSSCSRTCTGPTTRCSRSSSTSPTGPKACPLLVVATARPELFERHPDYAAGLPNANRINLAPLSDAETARARLGAAGAVVIPPSSQAPILDRAERQSALRGGVRPAAHGHGTCSTRRRGSSWELRRPRVPLPDSVQALIAARLDTLPPERKAMLADAAVIGKVFWAGAVARDGRAGPSPT